MRVFAYLADENDLAALEIFLSALSVNSSPVEFFGFTRISDETTRELLPAKPDAILVEAGSMARKIERFLVKPKNSTGELLTDSALRKISRAARSFSSAKYAKTRITRSFLKCPGLNRLLIKNKKVKLSTVNIIFIK
jgi:hypothetical protein